MEKPQAEPRAGDEPEVTCEMVDEILRRRFKPFLAFAKGLAPVKAQRGLESMILDFLAARTPEDAIELEKRIFHGSLKRAPVAKGQRRMGRHLTSAGIDLARGLYAQYKKHLETPKSRIILPEAGAGIVIPRASLILPP